MDKEKWIQVSVADVTTQVGKTRVDQAEQGVGSGVARVETWAASATRAGAG